LTPWSSDIRRITLQKPLVPIDGSESAMRALSHAIAELRDRAGVQVHLLNVQTPPVHTFPGKLALADRAAAVLQVNARR